MTHSRPLTRPMPVTMPGAGDVAAVQAVRGELRELQERAAGVQQHPDALARGQLAGRAVLVRGRACEPPRATRATSAPQIRDQRAHGALVVAELLECTIDPGEIAGHGLATIAGLSDNHTI